MAKHYSEDSIQVLEGLDAVIKRPGMYIGSTDKRGLHHLVWEILDNSVDEALVGAGDKIIVTITKDNGIIVEDFGRGIPVGMHTTGILTPELIFGTLHAGGKFGDGGYTSSGGLHGVGASVVNALSSKFYVEIKRDGKVHELKYENGGKIVSSLKEVGNTKSTGTKIFFQPNDKVFSETKYNFSVIAERLRETAFLINGLTTTLIDERTGEKEEYLYDNGLTAFVEFINEDKVAIHPPVYFSSVDEDTKIEVECAFQYTTAFSENIVSFANNIRTREGGTHDVGAKTAVTRMVNDYAKSKKLLKGKINNLDGNDIREGLTLCLSVRIPENLFLMEGQTKTKLGTTEARSVVEKIVGTNVSYFLEESPNVAKVIVERAVESNRIREEAKKEKDSKKSSKNSSKSLFLSGKLTPCQSKDSKKNELFIVEGDSAGGSAKQGRNRNYQAILPLRGKVLNSEKARLADIIKNEEINSMIYAIGAGVGRDFDITKVKYDKVIIMTDADTDGAHIQTLLLTFFYRFMRELVESGKVYIAMPPLYKLSFGKNFEYIWEEEELRKRIDSKEIGGKNYLIQRYKGLGEMNADQLWETTMDPETRFLIQVGIEDQALAEKRVSVLMGEKVEPRRKWIDDNVDFTFKDSLVGDLNE